MVQQAGQPRIAMSANSAARTDPTGSEVAMDQLLSFQPLEDPSAEREACRLPARRGGRNDTNRSAGSDELAAQAKNYLGEARLIRFLAVQDRVGIGRTAVYELIKAGKFPRPVKIGAASAWIDIEITRWIEHLAVDRGGSGRS
jgi:prophage regulatory protein